MICWNVGAAKIPLGADAAGQDITTPAIGSKDPLRSGAGSCQKISTLTLFYVQLINATKNMTVSDQEYDKS